MSSSAPKPIAEGHLDVAPLAHVILSLHRRAMSGTLAVWPDDERPGQDRLLFANGFVTGARLTEPATSLERGILPLFRRESAPYAFYNLNLLGDGANVVTGRVHPFAVVAAAVRGGAREDAVAHALARHTNETVRLVTGFDVAPFDLIPKERAVLELLRAEPTTIDVLVERSGDAKVARRLLYLLSVTDGIEAWQPPVPEASRASSPPNLPGLDSFPPGASNLPVPNAGAGPSAPRQPLPPSSHAATPASSSAQARQAIRVPTGPEPVPPPPTALSSELQTRWRDLATESALIDTQNYFQMLGLDESANAEQARDAYFVAVKKWHPDRLPPELAPVRHVAEGIFRYLTEAKDTLTDENQRLRYLRIAREGGGTPASDRKMIGILTAAQEFDKATVLSNRGRFDEALAILDVVLELDPDQGDHYALKAWAKLHAVTAGVEPPLQEILSLCEAALSRAPQQERAMYTKGVVLKRLGKDELAYACFRAVVERNARHVDASREMRLHEMRSRGVKTDPSKKAGDEPSKSSALFSKLWSGKKP